MENLSKLTKVQLVEKFVQKEAESARKEQLLRSCKSESATGKKTVTSLEKKTKSLQNQLSKAKELKTTVADRNKEIKKLKARIHALEKETKEEEKNLAASASKAYRSFRLDFYLREKNELVGKIANPLSDNKLTFKGFNQEKILGFIQNYLPEATCKPEAEKTPQSAKTTPSELELQSKNYSTRPVQKENNTDSLEVELENLVITTMANDMELKSLNHQGNFDVKLTFDEDELKPLTAQDLTLDISIYARGLDNSNNTLISQQNNISPPEKELAFTVYPNILRPGMYRIGAALNVKDKNGNGKPISLFKDGNLVHVF